MKMLIGNAAAAATQIHLTLNSADPAAQKKRKLRHLFSQVLLLYRRRANGYVKAAVM
jgi:hypothetical protein